MKKNKWTSFIYVAPALFMVGIFLVYPIIFNLITSFSKWKGLNYKNAVFVGFQNYLYIMKYPIFLNGLKNCLLFMVLTLFFQMSIGLFLTVLLNMKLFGYKLLETVYFFPVVLSSVVVGYSFLNIFEPNFGALNKVLAAIGLQQFQRMWIG